MFTVSVNGKSAQVQCNYEQLVKFFPKALKLIEIAEEGNTSKESPDTEFVLLGLKNRKYYKCSKRTLHFCAGTIKKMADGSIVMGKPHTNHERENDIRHAVEIFKNILKARSKSENTILKNIYDEESRRYPIGASSYPWSTAESLMRLARRSSLPPLPRDLQNLAMSFENNLLERFQCCDINIFRSCVRDVDEKNSTMFACPNLVRLVLSAEIEEFHVDATFKVVPANMGYQLLSVHAIIQNYSIPIIFALMEAKSRNAYESVFNYIKHNILVNIAPKVIITDYETALRDVLQSNFPTARIAGCWFHHNQAVFENMRSKGYHRVVKTNNFALKTLQLLFSIPLLPAREIERSFHLIKSYAINHGVHMENLFSYYQRYWIQTVGPQIISVHGLPRRTNNNIESFHNQLRIKFSVTHPNLWVFLDHLSNIFKNYHILIQQIFNNLQPTRKLKSKYLLHSKIIKNAANKYDSGIISSWSFMQIVSHSTTRYLNRQINWIDEIGENQEDELDVEVDVVAEQNNESDESQVAQIAPEQNQSTCMVCMTITVNSQQYIVLPCGHAWICDSCMLALPNQRCPLCRTDDVIFQRIFYN